MNQQRGVALITVLLVVALVAIIAVSMSGRLQGQISRVQASEQSEQAYWHWLSAEALVRQVLVTELQEDGYFHKQQNWATQQGPFPVDGGYIGGRIQDLQSCFNLNALYAEEGNESSLEAIQYQTLLQELEFDDFTIQQLTATLIDWLDEDTRLVNQYGAEDADYESMPQPYQAANYKMTHISELRQVRGYTQEVYERLRPYVCVIPGVSELRININTVDAEQPQIVAALFAGNMSVQQASDLLNNRPQDGYSDLSEVRDLPEIQSLSEDDDEETPQGTSALVTTSEYFELRAAVQYGETEFFAISKLHISSDGQARTIYRARRGYDWND